MHSIYSILLYFTLSPRSPDVRRDQQAREKIKLFPLLLRRILNPETLRQRSAQCLSQHEKNYRHRDNDVVLKTNKALWLGGDRCKVFEKSKYFDSESVTSLITSLKAISRNLVLFIAKQYIENNSIFSNILIRIQCHSLVHICHDYLNKSPPTLLFGSSL